MGNPRANAKNPNNPAHTASVINRINQLNPNNPAYHSSRAGSAQQLPVKGANPQGGKKGR